MYLTESSQGWGEATLKPGPKSARGTMGAPFSDRPPVTDPRYVFSPAVTMVAKYERRRRGDGTNPFVDPEGYRAYVAEKEQAFRATLAAQRGAKDPVPAR